VKSAEKLVALRAAESDVFRLDLGEDLFVCLYGAEGSESVGFWIPNASIGDPKTLALIRSGAFLLGLKESETTLKAVGTAGVVEKFATLDARGWKKTELRPRPVPPSILFYPFTARVRVSVTSEEAAPPSGKIKVLIVDDSKTIRQLLEKILRTDPQFEIVGSFERPSQVLENIGRLNPDVVTLDIHMPEMDGVALLKRYLPLHPVPTVMISSISFEEGPIVLSALEAGAVDYIQKPSYDQLGQVAPILIEKIKMAALAKVILPSGETRKSAATSKPKSRVGLGSDARSEIVLTIGASTGGTEALRQVLTDLPGEIPPILICQHIPPVFSKAFADRMNSLCAFAVKEAENGDEVLPNRVLVAPGGTQMKMVRDGNRYCVRVDPTAAPVNRHKPSVDVLFDSVAELAGPRSVGVILTGMGADGAKGLLKMREAGARTIGQDEATCVVYGMPHVAFTLGAVEKQLPLGEIAKATMELVTSARAKAPRKAS